MEIIVGIAVVMLAAIILSMLVQVGQRRSDEKQLERASRESQKAIDGYLDVIAAEKDLQRQKMARALTAGKKCRVCGEVRSPEEIVPIATADGRATDAVCVFCRKETGYDEMTKKDS